MLNCIMSVPYRCFLIPNNTSFSLVHRGKKSILVLAFMKVYTISGAVQRLHIPFCVVTAPLVYVHRHQYMVIWVCLMVSQPLLHQTHIVGNQLLFRSQRMIIARKITNFGLVESDLVHSPSNREQFNIHGHSSPPLFTVSHS